MPTISQFSPVLNLGVASANNVKTSAVANPQNATSVRITNNKIAAGIGISFPKVNGSGENGITVGGKSGEYSSGCIIQGNSIFSDSHPYTNGIEIGSNIKNIIVAENDICGFSLNGVLLNQRDGYIGSIIGNSIKRKEAQDVVSFIGADNQTASTLLITNNYFSHDTVDNAGNNWTDTIKYENPNWTIDSNINHIKEIYINAGCGNVFDRLNNLNNSLGIGAWIQSDDNFDLVIKSPTVTTNENPISPIVGEDHESMVRVSFLNPNGSGGYMPANLNYNDDISEGILGYILDEVGKKVWAPTTRNSPVSTDANGDPKPEAPFSLTINDAFCNLSKDSNGVVSITNVGTTATTPFSYGSTGFFKTNDATVIAYNYPQIIPEYNWLANDLITIILSNQCNAGTLYCKIEGSTKGFDGIYLVNSVTIAAGNAASVKFKLSDKVAGPIANTKQVLVNAQWVINFSDLIGYNKYIRDVVITLNPSSGKTDAVAWSCLGDKDNINKLDANQANPKRIINLNPEKRNTNTNSSLAIYYYEIDGSITSSILIRYKC